MQVVWFKRDLRLHDHRPLQHALAAGGPLLALYVAEPTLWRQADRSARHRSAFAKALVDLDRQLGALGARIAVFPGESLDALMALRDHVGTFALWAHEETGSGWTFERDLAVIEWCRAHAVPFREQAQFGVTRGLRERDGWAGRWNRTMGEPLTPPPRHWPSTPMPPGFVSAQDFFDQSEP
ncbi:MAG: deoxyribodipyrimidine photo-lyase [Pseudomonadota bacterium]